MSAIQPTAERATNDYEAAFMFLSLSLSLILSRSILPFSASTSAVVFGRSRKDDGLMRNLEVSRRSPDPQGGVRALLFTSEYKAH